MDNNLLWAASGSSSVKRWRVPQGLASRAEATNAGTVPANGDQDSPDSYAYSYTNSLHRRRSSAANTTPVEILNPRGRTHLSAAPSITASFVSSTSSLVHDASENDHLMDTLHDTDTSLYGVPYASLVKLTSPHGEIGVAPSVRSRDRDADVSTLYSAASVMSVPRQVRSSTSPPVSNSYQQAAYAGSTHRSDTLTIPSLDGHTMHPLLSPNARAAYEEREVAPDAVPLNDAPEEVIEGEHGLVRVTILNDRVHALTVDTAGAVAIWDLVRGQCRGVYSREDVLSASSRGGGGSASSTSGHSTPAREAGASGGDAEQVSPRTALETVKERIEGEAVVMPWALADTKIGELTIQLTDRCFEAEIFADEAGYGPERSFNDEQRRTWHQLLACFIIFFLTEPILCLVNVGKWVLRNLFVNFIREEQRSVSRQSFESSAPSSFRAGSHPRSASEASAGYRSPGATNTSAATMAPALVPYKLRGLSPIPQSPFPSTSSEPTPRPIPTRSGLAPPVTAMPISETSLGTPTPGASLGVQQQQVGSATPSASATAPTSTSPSSHDYFSLRRRTSTSAGGDTPDDFSGWGGPASAVGTKQQGVDSAATHTPSTPSGLMGRLKNLGKSARKTASEAETPAGAGVGGSETGDGEGGVSSLFRHFAISRVFPLR